MSKRPIMNTVWVCNECDKGPCYEHRLVDTRETIDWNMVVGCKKGTIDQSLTNIASWSVTFGCEE